MAQQYVDLGHMPVPLKPGSKDLESIGVTGKKNPFPRDIQAKVDSLLASTPPGANIGIWLAPNIVGIDIDNYSKGEKDYTGWDDYQDLVHGRNGKPELGALPPTWVTSARTDGKSGIRHFRIPDKYVDWETLRSKLSWSGKAADNIDVIHRGYRYAVVHPSIHPDIKEPYEGFGPMLWASFGNEPFDRHEIDRSDRSEFEPSHLFQASDLAELPESWIKYLSREYTTYTDQPINMDLTGGEINEWYRHTVRGGNPCKQVQKNLEKYSALIKESAESHGHLTDGVWTITNCGVEGHQGAGKALNELAKVYYEELGKREKRPPRAVKGEIYRSVIEAKRKVRGAVDAMRADGVDPIRYGCTCFDLTEIVRQQEDELASTISLVPLGAGNEGSSEEGSAVRSPNEYRMNDDGNAEFLYDLTGHDNLKFVGGINRFIMWNGTRWRQDDEIHTSTMRIFQKVRDRQEAYAATLWANVEASMAAVEASQEAADGGVGDAREAVKEAKKEYNRWQRWAETSGELPRKKRALESYPATSPDSVVKLSSLDQNRMLMGMANGMLELNNDGVVFREAHYSDYVTLNTHQRYYQGGIAEIVRQGGDAADAVRMWKSYLKNCLPDLELREFVQRAFGAALGGPGKERLIYFLYGPSTTGKSTLIDLVEKSMGDYAAPINLNIFKAAKLNPALGEAMDQRVCVASEVSVETGMDEGIIKQITGNDPISVEYKNSNEQKRGTFKATVAIATNISPKINGADEALMRRLCVMPFNEVLSNEDPDFKDNFIRKGGAVVVMHWLIDGYRAYAQKRLKRTEWPERVIAASRNFGHEMSDIGQFVKETLIPIPFVGSSFEERAATCIETKTVFKAYESWCNRQKISEQDRLSLNRFSRQLSGLGFVKGVHRLESGAPPVKVWEGVKFDDDFLGGLVKFKG